MIDLNKVYHFSLKIPKVGDLTTEEINEVFQDGRQASPVLERQLVKWFPELTHIKGCKDHDHIDTQGNKYDAKNFTKRGLKFMPSKMIGVGRSFNKNEFHNKAKNLTYIVCDIVDFPQIKVVFKNGKELIKEYPNGSVSISKRKELFND